MDGHAGSSHHGFEGVTAASASGRRDVGGEIPLGFVFCTATATATHLLVRAVYIPLGEIVVITNDPGLSFGVSGCFS